ncbi:MAG: TIGR00730 family Rossman fold protein [Planctomycetota bacterium]
MTGYRHSSNFTMCVFCGATAGTRPEYAELARTTGRLIAERGMTLIYGGGHLGMMGEIADAALEAGGEVIGVIPSFLIQREIGHKGINDLIVVDSMHERKAVISERCDAIMALPGGVGTLDELFEAITWNQLGLQRKPIGVLSASGYFEPLRHMLDTAECEGFVQTTTRDQVRFADEPEALIDALVAEAAEKQ